jgi:predicted TIM-barrel fold metal-dependent hydrolase
VAIGHFGMVTTPRWQEQIRLARYPNVYIESGGITWLFNREFYPYPSAVRAILEARDLCGMEKAHVGSDYPRTMTAITYRMSWDFVASRPAGPEEKQLFFYRNAEGFYRFHDLPQMPYVHHMAE